MERKLAQILIFGGTIHTSRKYYININSFNKAYFPSSYEKLKRSEGELLFYYVKRKIAKKPLILQKGFGQ